ncbi:MAG TPA: YceI family protein [Anaeromyxobacter sp.]|nr:YceI family protein [Anaeromyxobacter sp.]
MRTLAPALLLLAAAFPARPAAFDGLEVVPAGDGIRVKVGKQGFLSMLAHDHDFEVTRWSGAANVPDGDPGGASLSLTLDAASLRDRGKGMLAADRRRVDSEAAGPEVLDAARYPQITFRSERVEVDGAGAAEGVRGTLHGRLSLHGQERPVAATFEARREGSAWHVRGQLRFRQSDFGMKPFVGFGGTIGVQDEVEVRFEVDLRPAGLPGDGPG